MNLAHKKILAAIGEFLLFSFLALSVTLILIIDIRFIGHGVSESSLTECSQEVLIIFCALRFALSARHHPQARGFLVLVAGFFFCMFIRELDGFFAALVFPGFWVWLATLTAALSITWALVSRNTFLLPLADFIGTKSYFFIFTGLIMLLIFSRTFGSGALVWKHIMGDQYQALIKAAFQEGLELFGYIFIAYGTCLFSRKQKATPEIFSRRQTIFQRPWTAKKRSVPTSRPA